MTAVHSVRSAPAPSSAVAPWWHTAILIAILLALAVRGAVFQSAPPGGASPPANVLPLYLSLIIAELGLVYFVSRGIRRSGTAIQELIGGRWRTASDVTSDVLRALALWALWTGIAAGWERWLPVAGHARSIGQLLPHAPLEIAIWVVLSIVAGIAEEIVFRGYLQRQFGAWTGSRWLALALQAVVFGASHGYQGVDACLRITAYGALFGAMALWRKSLRPGMIAHAWTDIASGVFRI
jgi:membrane protease YdiL (CAAX protease family)